MKSYLIITAVLFGLLAIAHLLRTITEWSRLATDPGFLVEAANGGLLSWTSVN